MALKPRYAPFTTITGLPDTHTHTQQANHDHKGYYATTSKHITKQNTQYTNVRTYRLTLGCRKYTRGSYQYCARAKPESGTDLTRVFSYSQGLYLFVAMGTVVADNDN